MSNITLMSDNPEMLSPAGADRLDAIERPRSRWHALIEPSSTLPTYVGVVVALVGFALIGIGWARVAGLIDVWRQMPYLLSAGLPGLGLVMTGLVVVNVSARRQDGAARARQMEMLTEALRDLRRSLDQ